MVGIFDSGKLFARYRVELTFRDKLMGGVPKDSKSIEGWILKSLGVTKNADRAVLEEQMRERLLDTLLGLGVPVNATMAHEEMMALAREYVREKHTNGFKRDADLGLFIEGRQVKAMLKESCNTLFPYQVAKWGATKKAPRSYLAERVFVRELVVPLGRREPDGIELVIGHVSGPQGPQSTLTYHEYVERASVAFTVMSAQDCIAPDQWEMLFLHAQENGLGALRSQGHGTFDVTALARVESDAPPRLLAAAD